MFQFCPPPKITNFYCQGLWRYLWQTRHKFNFFLRSHISRTSVTFVAFFFQSSNITYIQCVLHKVFFYVFKDTLRSHYLRNGNLNIYWEIINPFNCALGIKIATWFTVFWGRLLFIIRSVINSVQGSGLSPRGYKGFLPFLF